MFFNDNDYNFEWIDLESDYSYSKKSKTSFLTVSNSDINPRLYLNTKIMRILEEKVDFKIKSFKVGVNQDENILILKPLNKYKGKNLKLYQKEEASNASVSNISLINLIKSELLPIDFKEGEQSKRFYADWDENLNSIVINFNKEVDKKGGSIKDHRET